MFELFQKKTAPDVDKRVLPLHFFDDGPLWRAFLLYTMFVIDDVLDADKLKTSLERLVLKDGWWKLGARLRKNRTGNLEYHLPSEFSSERSAIAYTLVEYDYDAVKHPLACRLPRASEKPAIVCNPNEFLGLMRPENSPTKLGDYVNSDRPQLGLHIVSFKDATLVSLYWPHTAFDAMGQKALLEAWSLILQGKEDAVKEPYGSDFDPLATLGQSPNETHRLVHKKMGTFNLIYYGISQLTSFFRQQENRMVCIPASFVDRLRETAISDLRALGSKDAFLTESDVLCAWWTRFAIAHLPSHSSRTVVLNTAYDLRKPLQGDLIPKGSSYLSNAVGFINTILSVNEITGNPISYTASAIRGAINELGTREQVESFQAMVRNNSAKLPPFFGDRNMHMVTMSNWTKAKLFDVDFSAAVIGENIDETVEKGKPRYIQNTQNGLTLPNGFPIIGKDSGGNYWLSGHMKKGHWAQIEKLLAEESQASRAGTRLAT